MKKFVPFILPILAVIVVGLLCWRWFSTNKKITETPELPTKIEIENLSEDEKSRLNDLVRGIGDYKTVNMATVADLGGEPIKGQIRYEDQGERIYASVIASLPTPAERTFYQVWLKPAGVTDWQKSEILSLTKGGFNASFVIELAKLPLEVRVTLEGVGTTTGEESAVLLTGTIPLLDGQVE